MVSFEPATKVTVTYKPSKPVNKVALVGNFNNWDKDVDLMDRQEDGSFRFVISLEPGIYHYKFVLDDDEWVIDPSNFQKSYDGLGGDNNVLKVSA